MIERSEFMELTIIIPSYTEGENLKIHLPYIVEICRRICKTFEIVIVDTMTPTDATLDICRLLPNIVYLAREKSNAYGDAIRTGIHYSKGKYIIIMDADGSHEPDFIPKLWSQRENADIVIASRYVKGGKTENALPLQMMSRILNFTYRLFLNIPCADISNSFKLYRGDQLRSLKLVCQHFDIIEEILIKFFVYYPSIRAIEIPCIFRQRNQGETKRNLMTFVFSYLKTIRQLRKFKKRGESLCK